MLAAISSTDEHYIVLAESFARFFKQHERVGIIFLYFYDSSQLTSPHEDDFCDAWCGSAMGASGGAS